MRLYHSKERERFEVLSAYDDRHEIKAAGFWWDRAVKRWHTDDPAKARRLRHVADDTAITALRAFEEQLDASRAVSADVQIAAPDGCEYMPFQKAGVSFAASRKATLIADEMGLGKTVQAVGTLNALDREAAFPALVVCPASLKINWRIELAKWSVHDVTVGIANGGSLPNTDVVVVNYDILVKHMASLKNRQWRTLIADEAHYAKTLSCRKDKRTGELKWTGSQRAKALRELVELADRKILLTGTPITNRPKDLYPLLSMLDPQAWRPERFFGFAKRYCGAHFNGYGWDFNGASNLDELQDKLRSTLMIRRLKSEVLTELPAKTRTLVTLPSTAGQLAHEGEMMEFAKPALDKDYDGAAAALRSGGAVAFTKMAKVRHQTALVKAPQVVDFIRETLESEDKVIVFAHHKDVVEVLREGLAAYNPVTIVGDDTMEHRQQAVEAFQNNADVRVVIGNIQAAGVGLTLTAARTVIFAELDWTPANITQAEDRAHRIGQRDNVTVYHVVLDGSIDARLAEILVEKQGVMDAALDNRQQAVAPKPVDPKPVDPKPRTDVTPVDPEAKAAIHNALQMLAGVCDGATTRDDMGFDGRDTRFGKSLANADSLSDKQARYGAKMVRKYHRQLPPEVVDVAKQVLAA